MKIKFSLRIYFLSAMVVLSIGLGIVFFNMTTHYFIEGLDMALRTTMLEIADEVDVEEGQAKQRTGFFVASRWQDMPDQITEFLPEAPNESDYFRKRVVKELPFSRPKQVFVALLVNDKYGNHEYVAKQINKDISNRFRENPKTKYYSLIAIAVGVSMAFILIMILMMRSVTRPVEALSRWTKGLDKDNLDDSPPNFNYSELNRFAEVIRFSLLTSQQSIEREHTFLRHASHELRTPIAVIGNSAELLKRISEDRSPKELEIVHRIERAGMTMQSLTETLLWLSRENDELLPTEYVELEDLIQQLHHDLRYLLKGKNNVEVVVETQSCCRELPKEASRIILSNLIRNAFQHTQGGQICIRQVGVNIEISNPNFGSEDGSKDELGFGLGLYLCKKLCQRLGWSLNIEDVDGAHTVEVFFKR